MHWHDFYIHYVTKCFIKCQIFLCGRQMAHAQMCVYVLIFVACRAATLCYAYGIFIFLFQMIIQSTTTHFVHVYAFILTMDSMWVSKLHNYGNFAQSLTKATFSASIGYERSLKVIEVGILAFECKLIFEVPSTPIWVSIITPSTFTKYYYNVHVEML